uniref:Uncharacterized protein n=1 Tax=Magallana gigas TaxID=29159 RepID=A0A8W8JI57_MAGGI|nr:uncharacterized protein LOC105336104 isoform X1 [Crassostrea gigas]
MDIRPLLLDIMICLDVSLSVWDSTERPFTDRKDGPCCDGTLAFAAPPTMPCSSFQCCQSVEDVVVYPVNHALGYEFRCIPKKEITTRCFEENERVQPGKEIGTIEYKPKRCCDGLKFNLVFNSSNPALVIKCIRR